MVEVLNLYVVETPYFTKSRGIKGPCDDFDIILRGVCLFLASQLS
jgi:hypothetical protein